MQRRFFLGSLFIFFISCCALSAAPEPSATPAATPKKPLEFLKNNMQAIDLPAPVGEDMKGIIIPQYDVDGRLVMKFRAGTARKIDENQVAIDSLRIEFFEKDGKDITVIVPRSIFNLETKILTADSEVTIKREDFDMVGQSATFDTNKRYGTMKGHVHTEIRNGMPVQEL